MFFPTKSYTFGLSGARVDVNLNFIMHNKPYLVPKFPKFPTVGGDTPSHTLPIGVQYMNYQRPPTPCTAIIYTFRARFYVNLKFITHKKPGF